MLFKPTYVFDSVLSTDADFFHSHGIRGLILDLDNTLTTHNNHTPGNGVPDWIERMKAAGLRLIIVSNNSAERVAPFAGLLGLDFIPRGAKPLSFGYNRAISAMGLKKDEVCAVGDQIFTDIMGANLSGIRSLFVFPFEYESGFFFRVKRFIERPFLPKRQGNGKRR